MKTIKIILSLLLIWGSAGGRVLAQPVADLSSFEDDYRKTHVGIKAGAALSSITDYDSGIGFQAGLTGQYMFSRTWGVQGDLYVLRMNASISQTGPKGEEGKIEVSPWYLKFPVSAVYKFRLNDKLIVFPAVGGFIATGIGGSEKLSGYSGNGSTDYFGDKNNKTDYGLCGSVNFQYNFLLFSLGYDRGLKAINKEETKNITNRYNSNLTVSVGVLF